MILKVDHTFGIDNPKQQLIVRYKQRILGPLISGISICLLSPIHTVIVFDNRGIGNTTIGSKNFTIEQFAADSAGLLDVLEINKSNLLGYSMGGMIAQQLALDYQNKVNDLIIYASNCGGNQSFAPNPEIIKQLTNLSGTAEDIKKRFIPLLFTQNWIKQNPDYMENFASFELPSIDILQQQSKQFTYGKEYVIS